MPKFMQFQSMQALEHEAVQKLFKASWDLQRLGPVSQYTPDALHIYPSVQAMQALGNVRTWRLLIIRTTVHPQLSLVKA